MGMVLTQQRKAFCGVLAVALAGLVADRTLSGGATGPAAAGAAELPLTTGVSASGGPGASFAAIPGATSSSGPIAPSSSDAQPGRLTVRLERLRGTSLDADLFGSPLLLRQQLTPVPAETRVNEPDARAHEDSATEKAAAFTQTHRLTAIMTGGAGAASYAVVDGRIVRIGGSVDGATLIRVRSDSAVFENDGLEFDVPLRSGASR